MNQIYRNETRYAGEAYRALSELMVRRLKRGPRFLALSAGVLGTAAAAVWMMGEGRAGTFPLLLLLCSNMVMMLGLFAVPLSARLLSASHPEPPVWRYVFSGEGVIARSAGVERQIAYADISRVIIRSGYLFMFCGDKNVYIVSLSGFENGKDAFLDFFERALDRARGDLSECTEA